MFPIVLPVAGCIAKCCEVIETNDRVTHRKQEATLQGEYLQIGLVLWNMGLKLEDRLSG